MQANEQFHHQAEQHCLGGEVSRARANPGGKRVRDGENGRENKHLTTSQSFVLIMLALNSLDLDIKLNFN